MDILTDKKPSTNVEKRTGNDVEKLCYWDMFDGVIERLLLEECTPPNRNISTSVFGHQDSTETSGIDRRKKRAINRCKGPPTDVVIHHRKLSEKMRVTESSNDRISSYARRHRHLSQLLRLQSVNRDREAVANSSISQNNRAMKIKLLRDISDWGLSDEEEDGSGGVNNDNDACSDIVLHTDNTEEKKDTRQSTSESSIAGIRKTIFNQTTKANTTDDISSKSVNELFSSKTSLKAVTNSTDEIKSTPPVNLESSSKVLQKNDSGDTAESANRNKTKISSTGVVTKWLLNSGSKEGAVELGFTATGSSTSSISYRHDTDKASSSIDDAIRVVAGLQDSYQQFRVVNGSVIESNDRSDSTETRKVDSDKADEASKSAKSHVYSPLSALLITPVIDNELIHNVTDDNKPINILERFQSRSQHMCESYQVENVKIRVCTSPFESSSEVCDASVNPLSDLSDKSIHRNEDGINHFGSTLPSKSVINSALLESTSDCTMPFNHDIETRMTFDYGSITCSRTRTTDFDKFDGGSYTSTQTVSFTDEHKINTRIQTVDNKHSTNKGNQKRRYESQNETSVPDQVVSKRFRYSMNQGSSASTISVRDEAQMAGHESLISESHNENASVDCEQTIDEREARGNSDVKVDKFKQDEPRVHGTDGVSVGLDNVRQAHKGHAVSRNYNAPNVLNDEANSGKTGPLLTMGEGARPIIGEYKTTMGTGELDEDEIKTILNTLLRAQRNFKNVVPSINPEEFQWKLAQYIVNNRTPFQYQERKNAGLGVHDVTITEEEARKCIFLEHLLKYFEKKIGEIVKFAKCIPGFRELSMDDQANLIKVSRTESGLVGGFPGVDTEKNEVRSENSVFSMQDVGTFISPEFLMEFKKISKKVKDAEITEKEAALLRAIIITFTDRCHLDDAEHVQTIQNKLVTCLQYVLEREVKDTTTEARLGQLLHVLTSLRNYTDVDSKILQETLKNYPNLSSNDLVNEFLGPC